MISMLKWSHAADITDMGQINYYFYIKLWHWPRQKLRQSCSHQSLINSYSPESIAIIIMIMQLLFARACMHAYCDGKVLQSSAQGTSNILCMLFWDPKVSSAGSSVSYIGDFFEPMIYNHRKSFKGFYLESYFWISFLQFSTQSHLCPCRIWWIILFVLGLTQKRCHHFHSDQLRRPDFCIHYNSSLQYLCQSIRLRTPGLPSMIIIWCSATRVTRYAASSAMRIMPMMGFAQVYYFHTAFVGVHWLKVCGLRGAVTESQNNHTIHGTREATDTVWYLIGDGV